LNFIVTPTNLHPLRLDQRRRRLTGPRLACVTAWPLALPLLSRVLLLLLMCRNRENMREV